LPALQGMFLEKKKDYNHLLSRQLNNQINLRAAINQTLHQNNNKMKFT